MSVLVCSRSSPPPTAAYVAVGLCVYFPHPTWSIPVAYIVDPVRRKVIVRRGLYGRDVRPIWNVYYMDVTLTDPPPIAARCGARWLGLVDMYIYAPPEPQKCPGGSGLAVRNICFSLVTCCLEPTVCLVQYTGGSRESRVICRSSIDREYMNSNLCYIRIQDMSCLAHQIVCCLQTWSS